MRWDVVRWPIVLGLVAVAGTRAAAAQPIAVEPPPARWAHPHAGLGAALAVGVVRARGLDDGWLVRLEYEALPALAPPGKVGGYFGFASGFQLWRAGDDWGLGLPVAIELGVRAPGLRAGALVGFEAFLVDRVAGDHGVGFYAPFAGAQVKLDVRGWTAGADVRVTRRWQIGADDHTQWQLALVVGRTWETRLPGPIR